MSAQSPELVETFRYSRRIGKNLRPKFKGVKAIQSLARVGGASVMAYPANTSVDVASAAEMAVLTNHYPEIDELELATKVEEGGKASKRGLRQYRDFGLVVPQVQFYTGIDGGVEFGVPLDAEGHKIITEERAALGEIVSDMAGEEVTFPDRPSYLKIANVRFGNEVVLNVLADVAEDALWPAGAEGRAVLRQAFTYQVEAYPETVPAPNPDHIAMFTKVG